MATYEPIQEERISELDLRDKILSLPEYFSFKRCPEYITDPEVAKKAINLLDKIRAITGCEYDFCHTQQHGFGGGAFPWPINHDPTNAVNIVLGRYNRQFFIDLAARLRNQ